MYIQYACSAHALVSGSTIGADSGISADDIIGHCLTLQVHINPFELSQPWLPRYLSSGGCSQRLKTSSVAGDLSPALDTAEDARPADLH